MLSITPEQLNIISCREDSMKLNILQTQQATFKIVKLLRWPFKVNEHTNVMHLRAVNTSVNFNQSSSMWTNQKAVGLARALIVYLHQSSQPHPPNCHPSISELLSLNLQHGLSFTVLSFSLYLYSEIFCIMNTSYYARPESPLGRDWH